MTFQSEQYRPGVLENLQKLDTPCRTVAAVLQVTIVKKFAIYNQFCRSVLFFPFIFLFRLR